MIANCSLLSPQNLIKFKVIDLMQHKFVFLDATALSKVDLLLQGNIWLTYATRNQFKLQRGLLHVRKN